MRNIIQALTIVIVTATALTVALCAEATDAGSSSMPACVQVTTDSRWIPYGYNHVVILKNGCSRPAACSVATDVNPERQNVDVAANTSVEVTTFMGSPSSTFTARVSCRLK